MDPRRALVQEEQVGVAHLGKQLAPLPDVAEGLTVEVTRFHRQVSTGENLTPVRHETYARSGQAAFGGRVHLAVRVAVDLAVVTGWKLAGSAFAALLALERFQQPYLFLIKQGLWTVLGLAVLGHVNPNSTMIEAGIVGRPVHTIVADEFAFMPEAEQAFTAAMPTVRSGGQIILVSTPSPGSFMESLRNP